MPDEHARRTTHAREEMSVEELAAQELKRLKTVASESGKDDLRGAMLVVANKSGVETYPYVSPDDDPREISLWMLGAFMAHIADSASRASGTQMEPLDAARHADALMRGYEPDERGGEDAE